jgi:hypothetical protein
VQQIAAMVARHWPAFFEKELGELGSTSGDERAWHYKDIVDSPRTWFQACDVLPLQLWRMPTADILNAVQARYRSISMRPAAPSSWCRRTASASGRWRSTSALWTWPTTWMRAPTTWTSHWHLSERQCIPHHQRVTVCPAVQGGRTSRTSAMLLHPCSPGRQACDDLVLWGL